MKLLKLMYFAHGWHLAITDAPLVNERPEAWKFGPVFPEVYHAFKRYGRDPIKRPVERVVLSGSGGKYRIVSSSPDIPDDDFAVALLEQIWSIYGRFTAGELSALTHQDGTPWKHAWVELKGQDISGTDIPQEEIRNFFKAKLPAHV